MANEHVNKVYYGDRKVIDISDSTADENTTLYGYSGYKANGAKFNGGVVVSPVDDALSGTSENPVQNKVIKSALDGKVDTQPGKGLSSNDYTTSEKDKLSGIEAGAQVNVTIDAALSASSTHPVQNGVITAALEGKVDTEPGKGLSTNDFTTAEKNKLSSIEAGAQVNQTVDAELSASSSNPVQNSVVTTAIANGRGKVFYGQVDSTSTATAFTAQISGVAEYEEGLTVVLKNGVVTSASGFTIDINGLGALPVYNNLTASTRDTTIFNKDYTMMFIYEHRVSGGDWLCYRGYDANTNTIGYQLRTNSQSLPMTSVTYRYRLLFTSADHKHFVPANNSSSTNATASRTVCQEAIDPFGAIYYYGATASVAAAARPAVTTLWEQYAITLGYSFNRTGAALALTSWKPVYVKCAPQSDGSAIIDSTTPYVQDLPSDADGEIYIFLGVAYSATNVELVPHHPVYEYKNGAIRLYTNAVANGGVTSVNGQTGAVTVTEGLAPLIGTTATVTPQQVMTAIGEGRDVCITATASLEGVQLGLKFTSFNRATDLDYSGMAVDFVSGQTIAHTGAWYVFTLYGGVINGNVVAWTIDSDKLAVQSDLLNFVTRNTLDSILLQYVPTGRKINNKYLGSDVTLGASDVLPSVTPVDDGKVLQVDANGEWVVAEISSGGGGGESPTLLGQTPLKLTEETNVKLTSSGSCSYTLESDTVAVFDVLHGTTVKASIAYDDNVYKLTAGSDAASWYNTYIDIYADGLTAGTEYTLVFDADGCTFNTSQHITVGHYILYDNGGSTLVTRASTDSNHLNSYSFTATTARVKLRWYPSINSYYQAGVSVATCNRIYIDKAGATDYTDVVNSSGTFTDSVELGEIGRGVTISATPVASVYKIPSSGGSSKPLDGKTVVVFGDSLIGMFRGDTSATVYVSRVTGATVFNVGFGGCRMATHPTNGYAQFSMWALADAVATDTWTSQDQYASSGSDYFPEQLAILKGIDFNTVDYVVIHYGTNDFGGGVAIGQSSASSDHSTLCGAARYSIEKLLTAFPKLRIFLSLPVYRYWESGGTITYSDTYKNSQNNTLPECVAALKSVAAEYNIPVIDGYYELGINKINASTFLSDGTHHNATGRRRFGEFIGARIVANI